MWTKCEGTTGSRQTQKTHSSWVVGREFQNGAICKDVGRVWGPQKTAQYPRVRNRLPPLRSDPSGREPEEAVPQPAPHQPKPVRSQREPGSPLT